MFTTKWQPKVTSPGNHRHYIRSRQLASSSLTFSDSRTAQLGCASAPSPVSWDTTHTFVALVIVISVHMCFISCKLIYVILFELPLFNKHMKLT